MEPMAETLGKDMGNNTLAMSLNGAGSRNLEQTCYLCNLWYIYCSAHVLIVLWTDFGTGVQVASLP